ncbi:CHAT domain-containing protein [Armillaria mellea]|nr:CHAT domain-containing protein [Armillaria mellea]
MEPTLARRLGEVSDRLQEGAYFDLLVMEEDSLEKRKQERYRSAEEWEGSLKPLFDFLHLEPHDSSSESDPPRLWWCPTGPLSFLPLHAAGFYNTEECGTKVYEYVASSYTPTVGILADISNQPSEEFSGLLTVCQPHTPGQNPIPKTEDEVYSVVQVAVESGLAITPLDNNDATPEEVLSGMAEHSWIHLACHAHQDPTQPLESAFMLAGDPAKGRPLKLTEIAERANTKADFAFLSACQTATCDTSLSEESVHLAAGMLMAGYRRVIATMWAVNGSDAPIIAEMVYKYMLSDGKADSGKSCLALHHATASLREKWGEKNFMLWVPFIHYGA